MRLALIAAALLVTSSAHAADSWMTLTDWSYHLNRQRAEVKHLNERNAGIGLAIANTDTISTVGGYYLNSFNKPSWYAGGQWLPLSVGVLHAGLQAGAVTGYPKFNGRPRPYAAAIIGIEGKKMGGNLVLVPPSSDVGGGVVSFQLKGKF